MPKPLPLSRRTCLGLLAATGPAWAQSAATELPAFTENFAPLSYLEGGEARGFSCELLRLMAAEAKLKVRIRVMPWKRAMLEAEAAPQSLLFSLVRLPEREARYRWVGPIVGRRMLIYRLSRRTEVQARRLADLRSLRVGVARNSAAAAQLVAAGLRPDANLELGLDDTNNLHKLLAGRMDAIVMLDWAVGWQLRRMGLPADTLTPLLPLDTSQAYWFGLPTGSAPSIARRLQQALDRLRQEGRYERLRSTWFGTPLPLAGESR